MKILHISDTHGFHHRLRDLPEAGVVVMLSEESTGTWPSLYKGSLF